MDREVDRSVTIYVCVYTAYRCLCVSIAGACLEAFPCLSLRVYSVAYLCTWIGKAEGKVQRKSLNRGTRREPPVCVLCNAVQWRGQMTGRSERRWLCYNSA